MLLVKTYLDKSSIEGIGVFADEEIKEGTITWELNPYLDKILVGFTANPIESKFIEKYSFKDKQTGKLILSMDNDRFTNHSEDPNTGPLRDGRMIALRDILKGEEITSNYYDIDMDTKNKIQK